jgi:hypothetical protein
MSVVEPAASLGSLTNCRLANGTQTGILAMSLEAHDLHMHLFPVKKRNLKMQLEQHNKTIWLAAHFHVASKRIVRDSVSLNPPTHPPTLVDRPLKGLIRVRMSGVVPSKAKSPNEHLTCLTSKCYILIDVGRRANSESTTVRSRTTSNRVGDT